MGNAGQTGRCYCVNVVTLQGWELKRRPALWHRESGERKRGNPAGVGDKRD